MLSANKFPKLCGIEGCRLLADHKGKHNKYPTSAWNFLGKKDRNKITKAGFATPRGGNKGAYQNHVVRSNRVIIPFEKLGAVNPSNLKDGYVIRLFPRQYFKSEGVPNDIFREDSETVVGKNAFVLYRTHESFEKYPPLEEWTLCYLEKNGRKVDKRGKDIKDVGHYVLRISSLGPKKGIDKGPPQGLFAPEYADEETNYLCKCVLVMLIVYTKGSPYNASQASHLLSILQEEKLLNYADFEYKGILSNGLCCCPLCLKVINYNELHDMLSLGEVTALENAGIQVKGATRSTAVNLFHLEPLVYESIKHIPANVSWGHAVCNTVLGQRECLSLSRLKELNLKVGIIKKEGVEPFGWISDDHKFIRGPNGKVWIQIGRGLKSD